MILREREKLTERAARRKESTRAALRRTAEMIEVYLSGAVSPGVILVEEGILSEVTQAVNWHRERIQIIARMVDVEALLDLFDDWRKPAAERKEEVIIVQAQPLAVVPVGAADEDEVMF